MIDVSVRQLSEISGRPNTLLGVRKWLDRLEIKTRRARGRITVQLSDLPDTVRHAYLEQCVGDAHLDMGEHDDAAHDAFLKAPVTMRAEAERKAAMARVLVAFGDAVPWGAKLKSIREKFGTKGASKQSLQRVLTAIERGRSDQLCARVVGKVQA